jgi:hypothetical protein
LPIPVDPSSDQGITGEKKAEGDSNITGIAGVTESDEQQEPVGDAVQSRSPDDEQQSQPGKSAMIRLRKPIRK